MDFPDPIEFPTKVSSYQSLTNDVSFSNDVF